MHIHGTWLQQSRAKRLIAGPLMFSRSRHKIAFLIVIDIHFLYVSLSIFNVFPNLVDNEFLARGKTSIYCVELNWERERQREQWNL